MNGQINYSILPDTSGAIIQPRANAWATLANELTDPPTYPSKTACPLIKLATFGDLRTEKNCLRHDDNVQTVTGIEGDYDDEVVTLATAVDRLRGAGISCIVYTSASHTPDAPRWRVIAPFSAAVAPSERTKYYLRLNAALGGILASESKKLSQTYYYGRVEGVHFESQVINGKCLDQLPELDKIVVEQKADKKTHKATSTELAELLDGDDVHGNANSIVWRMINGGIEPPLVRATLTGLSYEVDAARPGRGEELRGGELDRMIEGAVDKRVAAMFAITSEPIPGESVEVADDAALTEGDPIERVLMQNPTQDNVALIFARRYAGKFLFVRAMKSWLEWDGRHWQREGTELAFDYARGLARLRNREGKAAVAAASFSHGVEAFCRADRTFARTPELFDVDNYLLNTPAGTVDLRTGDIRPHDPADHLTMITTASPQSSGGAVFRKFLDEITLGDAELKYYLQVALGSTLSGAVESHWLMFWTGEGRNGKNTLGDLVMEILGGYAKKIPAGTLMARHYEQHPNELAALKGVRLAISSEVSDGDHWNESRINELSGDAMISARFSKGDWFEFPRTHKHLIYGNHRPQLRSVTDALRARLKIVPFKASFLGREDADLPRKLRAESGFVLDWLIQGHWCWYALEDMKLPRCAAVDAESDAYFAAQSTTDKWIEERLELIKPDERNSRECHQSSALYRDYSDWKKSRGEQPVSLPRWAETMGKRFTRFHSGGVRYRGCSLLPTDLQEQVSEDLMRAT